MSYAPTPEQIADARADAAERAPLESCGLIFDGAYRPLQNLITKPGGFTMDPREVSNLMQAGNVTAVVHSHVFVAPIASEADRSNCERVGLPWLIVNHPVGTWSVIEPCGWRAPLIGREFVWGTQDCWSIVRDAYQDYAGLVLKDYERTTDWWERGEDLIDRQFADCGFVRMQEGEAWRHLDVAGMQLGTDCVNHLGIVIKSWPQPLALLHHKYGQLSRRQPFGGMYQAATVRHLRHQKFLDAAPELVPVQEVAPCG